MDSTRTTLVSDERSTGKSKLHLTRLALVAALAGIPVLTLPAIANAEVSIGIGIGVAPPALPVYVQPVAPGPGYIWTPGYWAWGPHGYYWIDGVWLIPPTVGMLWTPGWWGWSDGLYYWHPGYWGPRVGFYGGINYGFGYFGIGYVGGYWRSGNFYYNRAVNNINVTHIRNVYVDQTVINNVRVNRTSYNGGRGGIESRPTPEQRNYASQRHQTLPPMQAERRNAPQNEDSRSNIVTNPRGAPREGASPQILRNNMPQGAPAGAQPDRGPRQGMMPAEGRAPQDRPPQGRMQQDRPRQERMPQERMPQERIQQERMQQDRGPRPGFAPQPRAPEPQSRAPEPPRGQFREREARPPQSQDRQPEVRQQEYRPRGEAPAREERNGDARPEHRGEGRFR